MFTFTFIRIPTNSSSAFQHNFSTIQQGLDWLKHQAMTLLVKVENDQGLHFGYIDKDGVISHRQPRQYGDTHKLHKSAEYIDAEDEVNQPAKLAL